MPSYGFPVILPFCKRAIPRILLCDCFPSAIHFHLREFNEIMIINYTPPIILVILSSYELSYPFISWSSLSI